MRERRHKPERTYSFAKTPLNAAKAPEPMAQVSHFVLLGAFVEDEVGSSGVALGGEEESRGSSGCSGGGVGIRSGMVLFVDDDELERDSWYRD